ncbi:MAG: serine--tRNA ligase [Candidatus Moranbacteria bacterium]|nr:serine--tRNA ligase [Candidatus Moranbacteria bacterium]
MLDIQFIRENFRQIQKAADDKNINLKVKDLLKIDKERRNFQSKINNLQKQKNNLNKEIKGKPTKEQLKKAKAIKKEISQLEKKFKKVEKKFNKLMAKVPVIPSKDTPLGRDERDNVEVGRWGEIPKFDFKPKSYMQLARDLDLIDFKRGVKVAGYRGYYVKNEGVLLQMGMMMYALKKLIEKGFTPIIPPTLVREFVLFGTGYFEGEKYDKSVDNIYKIENKDVLADGSVKKENKFLVGTAEPSLLAYYANEVLDEKDLPVRFCGFSQCYRSEIGSYGKDTKGIYRVHEFVKVEQVCICKADVKESDKLHQEMVENSKELHKDLKLPFRQLQICTGDMAAGKYKMFDLEAWMPSRKSYGETGSASNFLDWQSRRLNVKYKDKQGNKKYVFMLNNTALPSVRPLISIMENHQTKEGFIKVPKVLQEYVGKKIIGK